MFIYINKCTIYKTVNILILNTDVRLMNINL